MKKSLIVIGALTLCSFSVGAATGIKVSAELRQQSIVNEGIDTVQGVLNYKGTTYVPLRSFSDMVGIPVDFKNGKIYLGNGQAPSDDKSKPQAKYNMNNPAPVGVSQTVKVKDYTADYTATIVVKEAIRGQRALSMLKEVNPYNSDPGDGYEYILVKIGMTVLTSANGKSVDVNPYGFKLYTGSNAEYSDFVSVIEPDPQLANTLYAGASTEGWLTFKVKTTDSAPKFVYGSNYDGTGGIWFSLK